MLVHMIDDDDDDEESVVVGEVLSLSFISIVIEENGNGA